MLVYSLLSGAMDCGATCPHSSASRTPVQGSTLVGGMKRFLPDVSAP